MGGGVAEAGPREITMDDLWYVAPTKQWTCILPLSEKTKTWFPDNDADSSDEEKCDANKVKSGAQDKTGTQSKSAKKREKKKQKQAAAENTSGAQISDVLQEPEDAKLALLEEEEG